MKKINIICAILAIIAIGICGKYIYDARENEDITPPNIAVKEDTISCTIDATDEELCQGLTATDDKDGDLTDKILVNEITKKTDDGAEKNEFEISYVVFDSANNMSEAKRTLIYTDYTVPHFALTDPLKFTSLSDAYYTLPTYLTAEDCIDGDISSQITYEMDEAFLNARTGGTYECTAKVTNSLDDSAEIPLSFTVYTDTDELSEAPYIVLSDYLIYLKKGDTFIADNYLDYVIIDNKKYTLLDDAIVTGDDFTASEDFGYTSSQYGSCLKKNSVKASTDLDTNTPGVYTVEYTMHHPYNDDAVGTTKLIVVVEE